jgi:hypothetical protein
MAVQIVYSRAGKAVPSTKLNFSGYSKLLLQLLAYHLTKDNLAF